MRILTRFKAASALPACIYTAKTMANDMIQERSTIKVCENCTDIESPLRSDTASSSALRNYSDPLQLTHMARYRLSFSTPMNQIEVHTPDNFSSDLSSRSSMYFYVSPSTVIRPISFLSTSTNTLLFKNTYTAPNLTKSQDLTNDLFYDPAPPSSPLDHTTWPAVNPPYHTSAKTSIPTNIAEMQSYVHYQGTGLQFLEALVFYTSKVAQTEEEEKCRIEVTAYLCWLRNVSVTGHWKKTREMTEGVERWREGMEAWGRRTSLMSEGRANGFDE